MSFIGVYKFNRCFTPFIRVFTFHCFITFICVFTSYQSIPFIYLFIMYSHFISLSHSLGGVVSRLKRLFKWMELFLFKSSIYLICPSLFAFHQCIAFINFAVTIHQFITFIYASIHIKKKKKKKKHVLKWCYKLINLLFIYQVFTINSIFAPV